ncbi:MAG: RNA pseudouridine synthase [Candidatus Liptonbacteria bacterium]|nr:RNA pseudouridine synthase [Parcubacteria group bacterium]MBI4087554.1 RNA pseudouridine synthase [Candidatus Liptonbacteria bacterium]
MDEPTIIHEDENFLIVNKPSGLLVHRVESAKNKTQEPTLADWLAKRYPELKTVGDDPANRPGIVHRLDRDVSGVMIVARNQEYFEYLKSLFQKRLVEKTYLALVFGDLKAKTGRIEKPIGIKSGTVKRSVTSDKMSKEAVTDYRVKRVFQPDGGSERFSLLEVEPKTGRTHQIRVHLASIGHPIVGDALYGRRRGPSWAKRIMLHALSLELPLMEGRRFKAEAEPPADYGNIIDFLSSKPRS